jgi:hypothetical protein
MSTIANTNFEMPSFIKTLGNLSFSDAKEENKRLATQRKLRNKRKANGDAIAKKAFKELDLKRAIQAKIVKAMTDEIEKAERKADKEAVKQAKIHAIAAKKADKEAVKQAKKADKEAAMQAKKADKEAAKQAKKADKEAAKQAKKADKEATKQAKKADKEATKQAKKVDVPSSIATKKSEKTNKEAVVENKEAVVENKEAVVEQITNDDTSEFLDIEPYVSEDHIASSTTESNESTIQETCEVIKIIKKNKNKSITNNNSSDNTTTTKRQYKKRAPKVVKDSRDNNNDTEGIDIRSDIVGIVTPLESSSLTA